MRLAYSIGFEDFKTLQRPFTLKPGNNAGFKGVLIGCVLMILLGVFCWMEAMGALVGGFLIGLGFLAAVASYLYEQTSVAASEKKYDKDLAANYQRIHCRDQRIFATDENGFTMSCSCQTVTRPWSELLSFSENETHFAFGTKMGGQVLPKSAFASEAGITEFRALVSSKLNQDKAVTAPHFDFSLTPADYRSARTLHSLKGGGWRVTAKMAVTYAGVAAGAFVLWNSIAGHNLAVRAGLIGGFLALPILRIVAQRRKDYVGKIRVYFGQEGLHTQYPSAQSRRPWSQFIGYLENDDVLLLYLSPKFYSVVPHRVLVGPAEQFRTLVRAKLQPYNYRRPNEGLNPNEESSVKQAI